ncbi:MAG: hypothetical protein LH624_17400 [Cryobacterium sp.]|nr:hypothetical protein [Cryobacterium sp.]
MTAGLAVRAVTLSGCAGAGGTTLNGDDKVVNVLMDNKPQMLDLENQTDQYFTKTTGIHDQ